MSRQDGIETLIQTNMRLLQKLKEQKAKFGLYTPAHLLIEIEDTEKEIERLQSELEAFATDEAGVNLLTTLPEMIGDSVGFLRKSYRTKQVGFSEIRTSVPVEEIVDRDPQFETFEQMIAGEDAKHLMFISAKRGRGKTCLLEKMRDHCRRQGVNSCWIDFRFEAYDAPHLNLAREICTQLDIVPQKMAQALLPLTASGLVDDAAAGIQGHVENSQVITQILTSISANDPRLHNNYIKEHLKQAFAADLLAARKLLVCFFDTFEDVSREEEAWLLESFFSLIKEGLLENVIVVTAGRLWPNIEDWEWENVAYLIDGLPPMKKEHIIEYAKRLGYEMSDVEAELSLKFTRGGMPLFMGLCIKNLMAVQ